MNKIQIILLVIITLSGFPIGKFIASKTSEELKDGRKWFLAIIFLCLSSSIIFLFFIKGENLIFIISSLINLNSTFSGLLGRRTFWENCKASSSQSKQLKVSLMIFLRHLWKNILKSHFQTRGMINQHGKIKCANIQSLFCPEQSSQC